jgi:phosphoribosylamine---glycine ligase
MNVLVIGRGGREHAICKKLNESPNVDTVFCAPGNAGIGLDATLVPIEETAHEQLIQFAKEQHIELVIVGPENPLLEGIVNQFQQAGIRVFGPTKEAALIEGSKSFAKALMKKYNIPTAKYETFDHFEEAKKYIKQHGAPIVIKADGLAAGKGVVVAMTEEEAFEALEEMMIHGKFGDASTRVVIEEFLQGEEFSLMAFVHGEAVYPMVIAQDHKRAFDHDEGPNTGGMGAYSPVPHIPESVVDAAINDILLPTAQALVKEGRPFTGILYAGLMNTADGPKVIEFNARFGDPETQVVLPRMKSDLVEVIMHVLENKPVTIEWEKQAVVGVVVAAKGYPGSYEKEFPLVGLEDISTTVDLFHAGTKKDVHDNWVANGGRLYLVAGKGTTIAEAQQKVYQELEKVSQDNVFFRRDIGNKGITFGSFSNDGYIRTK